MEPATREAYRLFMTGMRGMADLEICGIPVSREKLDESDKIVSGEIRDILAQLREHDVYSRQRNRFGKDANVGSRDQLAVVLYDEYKIPGASRSGKTGKYVLDDAVIADIHDDRVSGYLTPFRRLAKLEKLKSTYLDGLRKEIVNGRVHCFLNLHVASTYRGSSDTPNANNWPTRDKEVSKHVKNAVDPGPDKVIVEIDYSALEVHIAACYHKDPVMIRYLNSGYDMHADVCQEVFCLDDKKLPNFKALRSGAKNLFTFAEFYGDYYASVALGLWKFAHANNLGDHLASKGFQTLGASRDPKTKKIEVVGGPGTYVDHIKTIEKNFWEKRFPVYNEWRKRWWNRYLEKGFFHTLTGFRVHGVYKRNEVINSPIQGSAFHCLLQALCDIQKALVQKKMRSQVILEIHDSLVAEVYEDEVDEYVKLATDIMTHRLREKWKWLVLDLKVEVEVGKTWHQKKGYEEWKKELSA